MTATINANTTSGVVVTSDTSGSLALQTGGTTALTVDSSQNVGIGTSSPGAKLDVSGTIRSTVADGADGAVFKAASGSIHIDPYLSAGIGGQVAAQNLAGSAYTKLSLYGSSIDFGYGSSGTVGATLDSAGNLGLGVTPGAWYSPSNYRIVQIGQSSFWGRITSGAEYTQILSNVFINSAGVSKYINDGTATYHEMINGAFRWSNAASGTAGNTITFTQAMTLDASGNLLVGKTALSTSTVGVELRPGGRVVSTLAASTNAGDDTYEVYSTGAAAYRFYVGMGGTIFATSIVITAISDQRLKENVRDIETGLDAIMALKPRRFDWKEGKGQDKKNAAGFIAQEFAEIFPASVSVGKAGGDGVEYLNMNHEELIPSLVKAIQELKTEFDAYKASHP